MYKNPKLLQLNIKDLFIENKYPVCADLDMCGQQFNSF